MIKVISVWSAGLISRIHLRPTTGLRLEAGEAAAPAAKHEDFAPPTASEVFSETMTSCIRPDIDVVDICTPPSSTPS